MMLASNKLKVALATTVHLQDIRLFGSTLRRPVSSGAVHKLHQALKKRHMVCRTVMKEVVTLGQSPSAQVKDMAVRTKVTKACHDILCVLGPLSGRYCMLYGDDQRVASEK